MIVVRGVQLPTVISLSSRKSWFSTFYNPQAFHSPLKQFLYYQFERYSSIIYSPNPVVVTYLGSCQALLPSLEPPGKRYRTGDYGSHAGHKCIFLLSWRTKFPISFLLLSYLI